MNRSFLEWKQDRYEDIMACRNKSFRSLMTGTMATPHHTPWQHALDDSLASYLAAGPGAQAPVPEPRQRD